MDGVYISDYIYRKASMSMQHKYILVVFEFDDLKARDLKKNSKYILIDITLLQDGLNFGNFCTNKSACDV